MAETLTEREADILDSIQTLGPCTVRDLSIDTGRVKESIRQALGFLTKKGRIEKCGQRKGSVGPEATLWRVTTKEEKAA